MPLTFDWSYDPAFPAAAGATATSKATAWLIPGAYTVIPFVVTIGLAIITQEVLTSLLVGVFLTSLLIYNFNPVIAFKRMLDDFLVHSVADEDHAYIFLFIWCGTKAGCV